MSLILGTRIGPYDVLAKIGEGGMGAVYRAHDSRLDREVAIKVLPASLSRDEDRLRRFEQEARATSALNHPNILTVFDIGEHDGSPYIVAELLNGEELRRRIETGPIPVRKALDYARQIVAGLSAAHEKGIVHRDLKPENIFITSDDRVKILDFGLAKLAEVTGRDGGHGETRISPGHTSIGVVLGTPAYMSPEQVRGGASDHRSDIFSFGVILYEMLTGQKAFHGDSAVELMNAILKEEVGELDNDSRIPPALDKIMRRCLDKRPAHRFQSAHDLGFALEALATPSSSGSLKPVGNVRKPAGYVPWTLAALSLLAAATILIAWSPWRAAPVSDPRRLLTDIGVKASIGSPGIGASAVLSPDGKAMAFVAAESSQSMLYVRRLDQLAAQVLAGTEGAFEPFFSPRGDWIGFFTEGHLKKVPAGGGAVTILAPAPNGRGAAWLDDDTIVFSPAANRSPLMRVPASSGAPVAFGVPSTPPQAQRFPQALPGGTHVLFAEGGGESWDQANLMVQPIAGGPAKLVVREGYYGRFVSIPGDRSRGFLLYATQGTVSAAPFDLSTMTVSGPAFLAIDGVMMTTQTGGAQFDASAEGTLVYLPGAPSAASSSPLLWLDTSGKTTPLRSRPVRWNEPRFSPDGKSLALAIADGGQADDIWIDDIASDTPRRLTFDPGVDRNPVWSPDGKRIAFASDRGKPGGPMNIYVANADGTGDVTRLTRSENSQKPGSWHPTRDELLFEETRNGSADIMLLPLTIDRAKGSGSISGGEPRTFLATPANEGLAMISPDGRWVAYFSDPRTGLPDVFVRPYAGSGGPWQITTDSCVFPQWSPKSSELVCWAVRAGRIVAAPYTTAGDSFRAGKPRVWTPVTIRPTALRNSVFTLHPDGQRVVVGSVQADTDQLDKVVVVTNFAEYLKRAAKGK